ncbi:uncharacterized protein LOC144173959 [Haemaphysalis longicornis]
MPSVLVSVAVIAAAWVYGAASSGTFSCPSLELCSCVDERVDCTCPAGDETLDLFALFEPDVEVVSVRHCGVVLVPPYLVSSLALEEFSLSDIGELVVRSMAFEKVSSLRTLRLRNVRNLTLEHLALHGLRGTQLFQLDDVTTDDIPPAAIAGFSDVQDVEIRNSHIGQVQSMALLFAKGGSFRMINTRIGEAQNGSFVFDSVGSIEVANCSFGKIAGAPFAATNATSVIVRDSSFGDLLGRNSLLTLSNANATTLLFEANHIALTAAGALAHLAARNITFTRNTIGALGESSLPLGPGAEFADNSLPCACNSSWMWSPKAVDPEGITAVINSSFCSSPQALSGLRMSGVEPVPSNGSCRLFRQRHVAGRKVLARISGLSGMRSRAMRHAGHGLGLQIVLAVWMNYFLWGFGKLL